jgi:hypothetical protein
MILICLFFLRIKFALSVNWEILIPKINNAFVKMYGVIMLWIVIALTAANMISVPYKSNGRINNFQEYQYNCHKFD